MRIKTPVGLGSAGIAAAGAVAVGGAAWAATGGPGPSGAPAGSVVTTRAVLVIEEPGSTIAADHDCPYAPDRSA